MKDALIQTWHSYIKAYHAVRTVLLLGMLACIGVFPVYGAGTFYGNGDRSHKTVALSFDDGPGPATISILDILDEQGVKGSFFLLGSQIKGKESIVQAIQKRGHELCSHTFKHINFYRYKDSIPKELMKKEIIDGLNAVEKASGSRPQYIRIPNGYFRSWINEIIQELNVDAVHWTFGCDWQKMSADEMIITYMKAVKPGAILLFHDGGSLKSREKTIQILPVIIKQIKQKGYTIAPLNIILNTHKADN